MSNKETKKAAKERSRQELKELGKGLCTVGLDVICHELRMHRVAEWSKVEGGRGVVCTSVAQPCTDPVVYLIVAERGDRAEVLYAGRGVDGWEPRGRAHKGNVGTDKKPRRFHDVIREALGGATVATYMRRAGWAESDGQRVSTFDAEEQGLIAKFYPSINADPHKRRLLGWQRRSEDADRSLDPVAVGRVDLATRRDAWIGADAHSGELAIGILGLSHHGEEDGPTLTPDAVRTLAFEPCAGSAFFVKIASMVTGLEHWEVDRRATWDRLAFANYVDALLDGPRLKPAREDFVEARRTFVSKLVQLRADLLLVLGSDAWNNLPDDVGAAVPAFAFGGSSIDDAWIYPWEDEDGTVRLTLAVRMPHPSGPAWRREETKVRHAAAAARTRNVVDRFRRERIELNGQAT